jgi:hypothetical protein
MRDICTSDVVSNILASLDIGVLDRMFVINVICSYGLCVMVVAHIIPSNIIIASIVPYTIHHTIYLKKLLAISNIRKIPPGVGNGWRRTPVRLNRYSVSLLRFPSPV